MAKIEELYSDNFGIEEEPPKFKGTMELPKETAVAVICSRFATRSADLTVSRRTLRTATVSPHRAAATGLI